MDSSATHSALNVHPSETHAELLDSIRRQTSWIRKLRGTHPHREERLDAAESESPTVLLICPWLAVGGAEAVALELIRRLEFRFAIATTLPQDNPAEQRFREATPFIYSLGGLSERRCARMLGEIVNRHGIRAVIVNWSELGYEATPSLREIPGLWIGDIIHNQAPEGWISHAVRFDSSIDRHFAVAPELVARLREEGVESSKIRLAPNGVDAQEAFNPERYAGRDDSTMTVAFVGRLSEEKDPGLFVEVVAELAHRRPPRKIEALMVGDGPERDAVERRIGELDAPVEVLGLREDVPQILARSDYLLVTSRFEGAPLAPLEAMSMNVVVVSTDVGNLRDVIPEGIVESRDPGQIAERLLKLERDRDRLEQARKAARELVRERFDISRTMAIYAEELDAAIYNR